MLAIVAIICLLIGAAAGFLGGAVWASWSLLHAQPSPP